MVTAGWLSRKPLMTVYWTNKVDWPLLEAENRRCFLNSKYRHALKKNAGSCMSGQTSTVDDGEVSLIPKREAGLAACR